MKYHEFGNHATIRVADFLRYNFLCMYYVQPQHSWEIQLINHLPLIGHKGLVSAKSIYGSMLVLSMDLP